MTPTRPDLRGQELDRAALLRLWGQTVVRPVPLVPRTIGLRHQVTSQSLAPPNRRYYVTLHLVKM